MSLRYNTVIGKYPGIDKLERFCRDETLLKTSERKRFGFAHYQPMRKVVDSEVQIQKKHMEDFEFIIK